MRLVAAYAARLGMLLLLAAIALFAMRLLAPGIQITEYREATIGEAGPLQAARVYRQPYAGAAGYLAFAALMAPGLVRREWLPLAWLGLIALTGWSAMWLFSSGAAILPFDGVLALMLLVLRLLWRPAGEA
jgi:hypothetical protein